ncbi:hypothetical protein [Fimbriiglobus ruber]|uniref:hypothetical protein n=1 Tax=Fimbriiglobus ruber TaxID=1908690 RepID=UPI00117A42E2|nr:hypothetical protein [Fimbriiglobus ruber]
MNKTIFVGVPEPPLEIVPLPSTCTGDAKCTCFPCADQRFRENIRRIWAEQFEASFGPLASFVAWADEGKARPFKVAI